MAKRGRPASDAPDSAVIYRLGRKTGAMIERHKMDEGFRKWAEVVTQEIACLSPMAFKNVDLSWLTPPEALTNKEQGGVE